MKERKFYVCDFCGTQYRDVESCVECEKSHIGVTKTREIKYHAGGKYPDRVEMVFNDGSFAYYKR